jgi:glycosyltransferase involved in cell wall biosynthesis
MSGIQLPVTHWPAEKPDGVQRQTRWLQVLSHVSPSFGGIANSVPCFARATETASTHACPIVGFCDPQELDQMPEDERAGVTVFPSQRLRWMLDRGLHKRLNDAVSGADGVHIHGLWETHCMLAAPVARARKRPYVISAHGMLDQWASRQKRLKKAVYAALIEMRTMKSAACLRALSRDEVNDYRRLGLTNPIAIVPSAVDEQPSADPDLFLRRYPKLNGKRIVLVMGRIHSKKGLPLLLRAWERAVKREDAHLVIAGPDSDGSRAHLEQLTNELKIRTSVTFTGILMGQRKAAALAAATLFVLPSYSEGFSIAVLEALAAGLPLLVTTACHIPEVATSHCGWVVEPAQGPIEQVLREFFNISENEAREMGRNGWELCRRRFQFSVVGAQMAQVYDWLQGGNRPSAVEIVRGDQRYP